jgi:hypothetical protein
LGSDQGRSPFSFRLSLAIIAAVTGLGTQREGIRLTSKHLFVVRATSGNTTRSGSAKTHYAPQAEYVRWVAQA